MGDRSPEILSFAGYALDVSRGCVRAGQTEVHLRPKSFVILCHLVRNAGRIVTKAELFKVAWPRVIVTDDSLTRCISDIRAVLGDGPRRIVRTVPKRGYLFDAPVAVETGRIGRAAPVRQVSEVGLSARPLQARRGLSVAVLPFASHSAGAEGSALASIITDGVAASLLHMAGARVIRGTSAAQDCGCLCDPCRIARSLGVGFVLIGSEEHDATRIRVAAYLIDGMSGRYVWADECEASRTDPFAMKDMIVRRLARALQIELAAIKADRLSLDPATRDADVLALRGEAIFLRYGVVREEAQEAYSLCERALQFEPENVRALAILSEKFSTRVTSIQSSDRAVDAARAETLACQALTVDACSPHAHHAKARVLIAQKRPDAALLEATYSLDLNPNYIPAYLALCQAHLYLGEPKACIADAAQGMTLHPLDPYVAIFHAHTAYAYFMCQDERRAEDHLRRALISNPAFPTATAWLAAVLGLTGRTQEAAAVLHRYESLPGAVTRSIRGWRSIADAERPAYRAFRERLYAGLCAAGMQEG